MSVPLPADKLPRYSSWLFPCCRLSAIQCIRLCIFWARQILMPRDMHNLADCVVILSDSLVVYLSPSHILLPFSHSYTVLGYLYALMEPGQILYIRFIWPN